MLLLRIACIVVVYLFSGCLSFSACAQNSTAPEPLQAQNPVSQESSSVPESGRVVEAAVIHPFRSANVGTEVPGIIKAIGFEEGDPVREGDQVVELVADRYVALLSKQSERLKGLKQLLAIAQDDLSSKERILAFDAASRLEVEKGRQEVEVRRQQVAEAEEDHRLAGMDLAACRVKAPFTGHLAVRYKQPYEPVERLEKLFAVVDNRKVFAVVNIPEALLQRFKKGTATDFVHLSGKRYRGFVDRIGVLVDPKSKTAKIYVLIDNAKGELDIGTSGSIELAK